MRKQGNHLSSVLVWTGAALAGVLVSADSSKAAVVLINHQNDTPYVSTGDTVGGQLSFSTVDAGLKIASDAPAGIAPAAASDLNPQADNSSLEVNRTEVRVSNAVPKILVTGAAMGFGGLAVVGIHLLRRKEREPFGAL